MSCGSCNSNHNDNENCVISTVKGIIKAQRRAVEEEEDTCYTSCDRSIDDLISPFEENRRRLRYNTIPFILYVKHTGKPFIGSGITRDRHGDSDRHFFNCVESPIFRVKNVVGGVGGNENCVRLELLCPVTEGRGDHGHGERGEHGNKGDRGSHHGENKHCGNNVCDYFPDKNIHNFRATGICITVDLNCFCAITCLDPVNPIRARERHND